MPDIIMAVGGLIGRVLVATQNMIEAGGFQVAMQRGWQPEGQQEQRDDGTKALHARGRQFRWGGVSSGGA